MAALKGTSLLKVAKEMANFPLSADAASTVLQKDPLRSLKVLQETMATKLYEWNDPDIQRSVSGTDLSFESLKDGPAPVYIELPFHKMATFSG